MFVYVWQNQVQKHDASNKAVSSACLAEYKLQIVPQPKMNGCSVKELVRPFSQIDVVRRSSHKFLML